MRFEFGLAVPLLAVAVPVIGLVVLGIQHLQAWLNGSARPTARVGAWVVVWTLFGAFAGLLVQPTVDDVRAGRGLFGFMTPKSE